MLLAETFWLMLMGMIVMTIAQLHLNTLCTNTNLTMLKKTRSQTVL